MRATHDNMRMYRFTYNAQSYIFAGESIHEAAIPLPRRTRHLTKTKSLFCANCHAPNGVLNLKELGYSEKEVLKLTSPELYLKKIAEKQKQEW